MHITHQQVDCQKAKVHPGVQRDPVETRQRRARGGPCWPFPPSKSAAQCLKQKRWLKKLERCWAVKHCREERDKGGRLSDVYTDKEDL